MRAIDKLIRAVEVEFGQCSAWQALLHEAKEDLDKLKGYGSQSSPTWSR